MELHKCPDCGKRTFNDVCNICGARILQGEIMRGQNSEKKKEGFYFIGPLYRHHATVYVGKRSKIFWNGAFVLFVLIPLLLVGLSEMVGYDIYTCLVYKQAGWSAARTLPEIEQQTVYEDDGVKVTVDSLEMVRGIQTLNFTAENNSDEFRNVEILLQEINGCQFYKSKNIYMDAGEKGNVSITLRPEDLANKKIDIVEEISANVIIYNGPYNEISRTYFELKTSAYELE